MSNVLIIAGIMFSVLSADSEQNILEHSTLLRLVQEAEELFVQAIKEEEPEKAEELLKRAALRYESVLHDGKIRNGRLYYNLGNINYMLGDNARALLAYLRAERYIPGDLNLVRNMTQVRAQQPEGYKSTDRNSIFHSGLRMLTWLESSIRSSLFLCSIALLWISATLRLFIRRSVLNWLIGTSVCLCALLFITLAADAMHYINDARGVVLAEEVIARKGDGESYQPSFQNPLKAGIEFIMLEERGEWRYVQLSDGQTCWLPRRTTELVRDG